MRMEKKMKQCDSDKNNIVSIEAIEKSDDYYVEIILPGSLAISSNNKVVERYSFGCSSHSWRDLETNNGNKYY